jgi:phenylpropionate dioxygenase-like ring-hydroxylating dioxygenase large terminal subunit
MFSREMLDSFEPSLLDLSEACTLPPELYHREDFYEFEKDAIFGHDWLCVGREDQVPEPGDFRVIDIADEPLILVRDKGGEIRVLSAVCQHRGMQVAEGSGNCQHFRCPYHHWVYNLDGGLRGAAKMEGTCDFSREDNGLPSLSVEVWQGFVFASMAADPAPLAPSLRELDPFLTHFELSNTTTVDGKTLPDLPWNWKVMIENFNDPYHASRLHNPLQTFAPSGMNDFFDWRDDMNHISRVQHFTEIDGSFNPTKKAILPIFPGLTMEERKRGMFIVVPPTLAIAIVPDLVAYFIIKPKGANAIDIDIAYCFHRGALEHEMFDKLFEMAQAGVDNFNVQDVYATTMVQKGLRSRYGPRGRYSSQEGTLPQFNRWLVRRYRDHWPV